MNEKVSTSSSTVDTKNRFAYAAHLLKANVRTLMQRSDFAELKEDLADYRESCEQYLEKPLEDCRILEIGFGQRPFRFFLLQSLGMDVTAVDIEHPTLGLSDLIRVYQHNGVYRMAKGAVRAGLFDRKIYGDFRRFVRDVFDSDVDYSRQGLIVADSSSPEFWEQRPGPYDFVFSEDVFEHIPRANLEEVVRLMAQNMNRGGIACIRPMVYTGIAGGHHIDWYPATFRQQNVTRNVPAWDHLLDNSHTADTYMNCVSRREYVAIFERWFEVIHDKPKVENLGKEFLDPELKEKLANYDDYELFSNQVLFVLRKKS